MRYIIIIFTLLLGGSCQLHKDHETPIAQVFESSLYREEIVNFIPKGSSKEDSLLMAQSYIRNWITQKLLLHKAIENLSAEKNDIQKQVEDYRTSLLIHKYKQKLIEQRLADEISEQEIEKYYTDNEKNFVLATPIVKAVFFILPKNAPNLKDVQKWYKSDKPEDQENLEDYCLTHARKYDHFKNEWIEVKYLLNLIPGDYDNLEELILTENRIEKEDEENYYFLKIKEMRHNQTIAPLSYVREEITLILKNKKKLEFESDLEKKINEEGYRKNYVKIY